MVINMEVLRKEFGKAKEAHDRYLMLQETLESLQQSFYLDTCTHPPFKTDGNHDRRYTCRVCLHDFESFYISVGTEIDHLSYTYCSVWDVMKKAGVLSG